MLPATRNFFGTVDSNHVIQSKIDDWFEEAVHQMDDGHYIKVSLSCIETGNVTKRRFNYTPVTEEYFTNFS